MRRIETGRDATRRRDGKIRLFKHNIRNDAGWDLINEMLELYNHHFHKLPLPEPEPNIIK